MNALRPETYPARLVWSYVWGPISLFSAFAPLMVINLLQFPSVLLRPFSRAAYRQYNRTAAFLVWGWWAWSIQHVMGLRVEMTGDDVPEGEDAIVIANHQTMADVPVLLTLGLRKGRIGDTKWMVKDIIKYVPGVGWGMIFLDCLFLKRRWADDEANIRSTFRKYVEVKAPLWLVVFPEGTRITPGKLAQSRAFAAKAGLKPTERVLLPRPKGFAASVQGLRGHAKAVYDVTIQYPGKRPPTLVELVRGDVDSVRVDVRRFPLDELPAGEAALGAWLLGRFHEKDALLAGPTSQTKGVNE